MLYAIVAVIALILDQLVKYWTTISVIKDEGIVNLIPGVIHLTNVHNTGAAFSFLQGMRWFFVALCAVFVAAVIYLLVKNIICTPGARWCAVIVMSGAVGNAIDRIINGYVVDMFEFDFKIFGMNFPVFNLADVYLTVGVLVFCVFLLTEKPEGEQGKAKTAGGAKDGAADKAVPIRQAAAQKTARPAPARGNGNGEVVRFVPPAQGAGSAAGREQPPAPKAQAPVKASGRAAQTAPADGSVTYTQPAGAAAQRQSAGTGPAAASAVKTPVTGPAPVKVDAPVAKTPPAQAALLERIEGTPGKTEQVMRVLVHGVPGAETPASKPVSAPAAEKEESYDLDDILAEFRDL